jgi:thiol-disulfide isomerase/thioredoxin
VLAIRFWSAWDLLLSHGGHCVSKDSDVSPVAQVRVTLYRDTAAWCPYCQKVWMMLEEKQIPYKIEKINMRSYGDK